MNGHILIIDDEPRLRELYARLLSLEGHSVDTAGTARDGLAKLGQRGYQLVITDVRLPDGNGLEVTRQVKERWPQTEVMVVTAYGNIPDGIAAMKSGAFDYLTKGDSDDQIIVRVASAVEKALLREQLENLKSNRRVLTSFHNLIGDSAAFRSAVELARKVAPTDASVLLLGETGTGKEQLAQAIHMASTHAMGPFVAINCAAIPRDVLESELFGYRKGAFTGAIADKKGLFEEAHNGTLLLDEIGEMPPELQAKLLRVLEDGTFTKIGDTKPITVRVRIVAATHRDLKQLAEAGQFRSDLYFRLAVFTIVLPPLRQRQYDIPLLAAHFLQILALRLGKTGLRLSDTLLTQLQQYPWPGNIRELRNVLERAVILVDSDTEMGLESLPTELTETRTLPFAPSATDRLEEVERQHILKVLQECQGNKTHTARRLGIGVATLYRKLAEYGL
jgi:DNA-binding NtrC family response regulator